jgi:hypothetical protein
MGFFDIFGPKKSETISAEVKQQEKYEAINKEFIESGFIKPELLPALSEKIKKSLFSTDYSEMGFSAIFSHDDCLDLAEKKSLGLPTRQKISREMINSLSEKGKKLSDTKGILQEMYDYHSSTISRKYELMEMRNEFKYSDIRYRFIACLDEGTCIICGALDGTLLKDYNDIDTFVKHKCINKICRCMFTPVERGFGGSSGGTYAGWFRKLSVEDKKEILGEYYDRYKTGESLKDIVLSFTEETALKYIRDRKTREELRKQKEAKKPKIKQVRFSRLTDEELQEYRELLKNQSKQGDWISLPENLESEMDVMKRRTPKEQHLRLEYERKKTKK